HPALRAPFPASRRRGAAAVISRPLEARGEPPVGDGNVKLFGIEVFPEPFEPFFALRVSGIGQNFEQFRVAPHAAAVFRRAVALAVDAGRIGLPGNGGKSLSTATMCSQLSPKS